MGDLLAQFDIILRHFTAPRVSINEIIKGILDDFYYKKKYCSKDNYICIP